MKTAMQKLIQFLQGEENIHLQSGDYSAATAYGLAKEQAQRIMLSDEKQQIIDAHISELITDYDQRLCIETDISSANGEIYYNLKYTENEN